jgi:hypothetical protein
MNIFYCVVIVLFSTTSAVAQQYTNSTFRDLFLAAVSYHAVARVCGDGASINTSKKVLRRVVNFGEHQNLLSAEARYYIQFPDEVIARGEAQYRKDRYVGCSQAKEVINQLDDATKRFP